MAEEIDVMFGPDKQTPEGGVSDSLVIEALGMDREPITEDTIPEDKEWASSVLKKATKEQIKKARSELNIPEGQKMGGMVRDELGYMRGGMGFTERGPIKYAKGGAVKGKKFSGSY
jgi:hypothetical protein|tara:strand:- start:763 stop:1110 length:348 start_codon:yes stop_codon:yes gene_type:complete